MKRYLIKFAILVLTFTVGLFSFWLNNQFSLTDFSQAKPSSISLIWRIPHSYFSYSFSKSTKNKEIMIAIEKIEDLITVRVENKSNKAFYFSGYGLTLPCEYIIKSENETQKNKCWCGTGLGTQVLLSGESTTFTAYPLVNSKSIKIGYYFQMKGEKSEKIFWSEEFSPKK